MTIWRMHVACCISKATRAHEYAHAQAPVHPQTRTQPRARTHGEKISALAMVSSTLPSVK